MSDKQNPGKTEDRRSKPERFIKLSREDSIALINSLINPPALQPDAPLARAISRYQESMGLA